MWAPIPVIVRFSVEGKWTLYWPAMDPTLEYRYHAVTAEERKAETMPDNVITKITFPDGSERFSPWTEDAIRKQLEMAALFD